MLSVLFVRCEQAPRDCFYLWVPPPPLEEEVRVRISLSVRSNHNDPSVRPFGGRGGGGCRRLHLGTAQGRGKRYRHATRAARPRGGTTIECGSRGFS